MRSTTTSMPTTASWSATLWALSLDTGGAPGGSGLFTVDLAVASAFPTPARLAASSQPRPSTQPRMVIERLKILLKRLAAENEPTIAVCHKGIIRALLALAMDWPMLGKQPVKLDWSSLHCFRLEQDGTPRLDRINVSLRQEATAS